MEHAVTLLSSFGPPGLLAIIAFVFWTKAPLLARFSLSCAVLAALLTLAFDLWPARYELQIDPPPEDNWGGLYATGQPVSTVKATLLRNGTEYAQQAIPRLDIASRQLNPLHYDPATQRTTVHFNGHPQGVIPSTILERSGWRRSTDTVHIRTAALTQRITQIGVSTTVLADSAVRREFANFRITVDQWLFSSNGVVVTVYDAHQPITRGRILRRGEQSELSVIHGDRTLLVRIMYLGFQSDATATNFVQFLLLQPA